MSRGSIGFMCCLLLGSGCQRGPYGPAELVPDEDRCEHCRMAVSELRFAGQVMSPRGKALFFDDIGCLVRYAREQNLPAGATPYVASFRDAHWIPAGQARFLWAESLATPMGFGLAAFEHEAAAQQQAAEHPGRVLDWDELLREWTP